ASSPPAVKARASDSPATVSVPAPESKARERKFVVAPETPTSASAGAPKTKRAGAPAWFALMAIAAGVIAIVGLRGRQPEAHVASEPTQAPVASEAPRGAAAEPVTQNGVATEAPSASASAPLVVPPTSATTSIATAITAPVMTSASANLKPESEKPAVTPVPEPAPALEKPALEEPALEKPALEKPALEKPAAPSKPVEVHNAPPAAADGTEFDRAAARNALASAAAEASACRKDGDPSGTATITITFAPSGRITSANLQGPPFAGTATGGCIANTMRHATVPAFSGERVTVTKTIVVQ
ncbi:MAG: hypothetical protein ABIQ16_22330, partial [Polyangiaceae bacterium]